jgi:hypothetical protein
MGTSALTRPVVVYLAGLPSDRYDIKDHAVSSETGYKECMNNKMKG